MSVGTFKPELAKVGNAWTGNPDTWPGMKKRWSNKSLS